MIKLYTHKRTFGRDLTLSVDYYPESTPKLEFLIKADVPEDSSFDTYYVIREGSFNRTLHHMLEALEENKDYEIQNSSIVASWGKLAKKVPKWALAPMVKRLSSQVQQDLFNEAARRQADLEATERKVEDLVHQRQSARKEAAELKGKLDSSQARIQSLELEAKTLRAKTENAIKELLDLKETIRGIVGQAASTPDTSKVPVAPPPVPPQPPKSSQAPEKGKTKPLTPGPKKKKSLWSFLQEFPKFLETLFPPMLTKPKAFDETLNKINEKWNKEKAQWDKEKAKWNKEAARIEKEVAQIMKGAPKELFQFGKIVDEIMKMGSLFGPSISDLYPKKKRPGKKK